tara:strand:- start:105 stop:614 length:510 start_codon:yes stop_codon:yes gene_type:complete
MNKKIVTIYYMLDRLNYNIIFLLVISIVFFIIDYFSNGRFYKILNKINKITGQWKVFIVFIVFYLPKLIYLMSKKEEGKSITIYELFGLSESSECKNIKKNKKRKVSATAKKYVAANQKWLCNMCNNLLDASYEVDHIKPLYKGGDNEVGNLQALCRNCHGNKTIYDSL